jgi:hypothetical protein
VAIREFFLENFAGDLEYHPRRAVVYLVLGIASACAWIVAPYETRFTPVPLVFALGSLTLFAKGIFLFRKSSEGLGLSQQQLTKLPGPSPRKNLPPIRTQIAQIIQDFGTGPVLLWPLINAGKDIDHSWNDPRRLTVFLSGAVLFSLGWLFRRLTLSRSD